MAAECQEMQGERAQQMAPYASQSGGSLACHPVGLTLHPAAISKLGLGAGWPGRVRLREARGRAPGRADAPWPWASPEPPWLCEPRVSLLTSLGFPSPPARCVHHSAPGHCPVHATYCGSGAAGAGTRPASMPARPPACFHLGARLKATSSGAGRLCLCPSSGLIAECPGMGTRPIGSSLFSWLRKGWA